jgi:hypothetical protein
MAPELPSKAREIVEWLAKDKKPLKKHVATLDLCDGNGSPLGFRLLKLRYKWTKYEYLEDRERLGHR